MRRAALVVVICALAGTDSLAAQRLLEEWQVRPGAGAEALMSGAVAVFWNPSQVSVAQRRYEVSLMDLRAPGITGVSGMALAGAAALDDRTVIALGYERVGVDIEQTTTSPDIEGTLDVGENRFAAAASHALREGMHVGAGVLYTRLPAVSEHESVLSLSGGVSWQGTAFRFPVALAVMGATEGDDERWMAGAEIASGAWWDQVVVRGQYGAAGGELAPGVTHRLSATGEWRDMVELTVGAAAEPDGDDHSLEPVLGASVGLNRYRLGLVRETLPNDFGSAYSLRFSVGF